MSTTDDAEGPEDATGTEDAESSEHTESADSAEGGGKAEDAERTEGAGTPEKDEKDTVAAAARRGGAASMGASRGGNGLARAARRYAPFLVIAALLAGVIIVMGGDGDEEEDDGETATDDASFDYEDVVERGPMTPERAELTGEEFEAGPNCDPETGRIRLPIVYAVPCVAPFDGDNGGATHQGVTEDTIKVVAYRPDPSLDPVSAGLLSSAGADISIEAAIETLQGYQAIFDQVFETYGRRVEVEFYTATGTFDDIEKARRDAIEIAEKEPFAVVGGPVQASQVFADELAEQEIVSIIQQPVPQSFLEENFPYVWAPTTPEQGSQLAAEAIGSLAGPGPAEMAGDEDLRSQDRTYGLVHINTPDNQYGPAVEAMVEELANYDIEFAVTQEFELEPAELQERARTTIARLKDEGVTTVVFFGDPLMPAALTSEATAQDFFPEWILGPNYLADTAIFGRTFDQQQWGNGFGVAFASSADAEESDTSYILYTWAYDEEPPSNIYGTLEPFLRELYEGIHLAGPELTPETFRDAMFRIPPRGGGPTRPLTSRGEHGIWEGLDLGSLDSAALIWWDPDEVGVNEVGDEGPGMYRFANGGERYGPGEMPDSLEEAGIFDEESSVIEYELDELPEEDRAPDYEPPDLD